MFEPPRGISREGDIIDLGVERGDRQKSGAFYTYGDLRLGQGRENAKKFLEDNPELRDEIEVEIRREAGLPPRTSLKAEPVGAAGK